MRKMIQSLRTRHICTRQYNHYRNCSGIDVPVLPPHLSYCSSPKTDAARFEMTANLFSMLKPAPVCPCFTSDTHI